MTRRLADTSAAAVLVAGVRPDVRDPRSLVRQWARRGLLTRHGRDARGRTLYDLAQVHEVAERLRSPHA